MIAIGAPDSGGASERSMSSIREISQILQSTPARGWIARRFFHHIAPRHAEVIAGRLLPDETFQCFVLLANSRKKTAEALVCTDQRVLVCNNQFRDDEVISLSAIESVEFQRGFLSSELRLTENTLKGPERLTFYCQTELLTTFTESVREAMRNLKRS